MTSITAALGTGSGIDTSALVTGLVDAQFALKNKQLTAKTETVTAQISGVGSLKSAITGFSSALNSLVKGGTLSTGPTSSNTNVLKITTQPGKTVSALAANIEVVQLAKPQSAATDVIADRTAAIGAGGSFTLTFGSATVAGGAMTGFTPGGGTPVQISIDPAHSSLDDIAAAINAKNAGVTASIVSDGGGSRLVLKGATGDSQAFTLESADAGLSDLNIGVGATGSSIGSVAQDAVVKLDGIEVRRSSNTIMNLVDNVKLELTGTGTTTLGTSSPSLALSQAVSDFVETYNQMFAVLKEQTDPKTGVLRNDPGALALQRALQRLPTTQLASGDGTVPLTLAEIGVATNRDGTLMVDSARLATAMTNFPAAVEAMFRDGTGASGNGLAGALSAIAKAATSTETGLGASEQKYAKAKSDLADLQTKVSENTEKLRNQMTAQFAAMDARVAAYKSTQTFLTNQIAAWNKAG
jgi:flagellar hook-associated protein 2